MATFGAAAELRLKLAERLALEPEQVLVAQVRARFVGANLGYPSLSAGKTLALFPCLMESGVFSTPRHYALREEEVAEIDSEWTSRNREGGRWQGECIFDPRLAPKSGARTWATLEPSGNWRETPASNSISA